MPEMVDLETVFFGNHDTDDDHPWHEFRQVSETDQSPFDPSWIGTRRDIAQFLEAMERGNLLRWDTERRLCSICDQPFNDVEWEDRHYLHEPDCPRVRALQGKAPLEDSVFCECDMVVHDRCCPVCNQRQQPDEPHVPGKCVCCGHDNDGGYYGGVLPVCPKCFFDGSLGKWLALHGKHVLDGRVSL